jgi:hypothetical protein
MSSLTTTEDRKTHPTPTRRVSKIPQPLPPNTHSSSSQRQQRLPTPTPAFPVRSKLPLHYDSPTTPPQFDSPPQSPVPESPSQSPVPERPPVPPVHEVDLAGDLNAYAYLIALEHVPPNFTPEIRQDRASGPQDRWYYVIKGREVGVFNNW